MSASPHCRRRRKSSRYAWTTRLRNLRTKLLQNLGRTKSMNLTSRESLAVPTSKAFRGELWQGFHILHNKTMSLQGTALCYCLQGYIPFPAWLPWRPLPMKSFRPHLPPYTSFPLQRISVERITSISFYLENGDILFLRNVGDNLQDYTGSQRRTLQSTF